jgi:hypothetical protein
LHDKQDSHYDGNIPAEIAGIASRTAGKEGHTMTLTRFAAIHAVFILMLSLGSSESYAVNLIAFCADDPSMGRWNATGTSGLSCNAASQAEDNAKTIAAGFARDNCHGFSANRCATICAANHTVRLTGRDANGATFDADRQRQKGFPADRVDFLNQNLGFCARTVVNSGTSEIFSGPRACSSFPFGRQKSRATAHANSFCGCVCR